VRLVRPTKGRIRLLHVVDELSLSLALDPAVTLSRNWLGLLRQGGETILQQARERVRAAGLEAETVLVSSLKRRVWDAVVADSKHWMADLIVIGSHGRRGVGRLLMGSDAEQIARHAPVPVLLLHPVPGVATTLARPLAATPARAVSAAVEVEELELTFGAVSAGH
jgi:nucleotide-binding universal stress UspA family protein